MSGEGYILGIFFDSLADMVHALPIKERGSEEAVVWVQVHHIWLDLIMGCDGRSSACRGDYEHASVNAIE